MSIVSIQTCLEGVALCLSSLEVCQQSQKSSKGAPRISKNYHLYFIHVTHLLTTFIGYRGMAEFPDLGAHCTVNECGMLGMDACYVDANLSLEPT